MSRRQQKRRQADALSWQKRLLLIERRTQLVAFNRCPPPHDEGFDVAMELIDYDIPWMLAEIRRLRMLWGFTPEPQEWR